MTRWAISRATDPVRHIPAMHGGTGTAALRLMDFTALSWPAKFLLLDLPPGASEGDHTHRHDDPAEPPYDECYFVVTGHGRMTVVDEEVAIGPGDAIFVPVEVAHGVANVAGDEPLRILLTYIDRSARPECPQ